MKKVIHLSNVDFLLNNNGDIVFESNKANDSERLEFNFHYATSKSLLFNFEFITFQNYIERQPEWLQFNFNTYDILYDKTNKLATGDEFIKQSIKMALETELGTIRENGSIGSDIYKYRHTFMDEEKTIDYIQQCATEAIKGIVPNYEVKVYFMKTAYYDFYNAVKISVILPDKTMWFTL